MNKNFFSGMRAAVLISIVLWLGIIGFARMVFGAESADCVRIQIHVISEEEQYQDVLFKVGDEYIDYRELKARGLEVPELFLTIESVEVEVK